MKHALVVMVALAAACGPDPRTATQVLVSITAELTASSANLVRVRVLGGPSGAFVERQIVDLDVSETGWPVEFAIEPANGDVSRTWRVEAWALKNGMALGAGSAQGGFQAGNLTRQMLVLKPGVDLGQVPGPMRDGGSVDDGGIDGSAVDGSTTIDPCGAKHGGCDPLVLCFSPDGGVVCGRCPPGYDDANGDGTKCTDINECTTNNGGCGSATYYSCANKVGAPPTCVDVNECATDNGSCGDPAYWACTNNRGAAPSCADIDECAGKNVCTADYPCKNLSPSYTCRGQFADWVVRDSPNTFVVNADATVTDGRTGLIWQRTVDANTYSQAGCATYCAGLSLAGGGWRLPTRAEIESILDFTKVNPTIDSTVFPNTPSEHFWTSSPEATLAGYAWLVPFFVIANSGSHITTDPYRVRCVKGTAPVSASTGGRGAPPGRYAVSSGTVKDVLTELTWQRAVASTTYSWASAKSYCSSLALAGGGWRLPTVSELITLEDPTDSKPSIDVTAFPSTPQTRFWSSSAAAGTTAMAWCADFGIGYWIPANESDAYGIRCVR